MVCTNERLRDCDSVNRVMHKTDEKLFKFFVGQIFRFQPRIAKIAEILAGGVIGYDRNKRFQQSDHTLGNVTRAVYSLFHESVARVQALQRLASYIVLDAFIGNTDRHHGNWGILETRQLHAACNVGAMSEVAPTFDHASSLGRELTDERRKLVLANGKMSEYLRNGHGAVYWSRDDRQGENPQRLLARAMHEPGCREHFLPALTGVISMSKPQLSVFLESVPEDRMSEIAKTFCAAFLAESLKVLKGLV